MMWEDCSDDCATVVGKRRRAPTLAKRPASAPAPKHRRLAEPHAPKCASTPRRASRVHGDLAPAGLERLEAGTITVGSDCAGMVTEGLALEILGVPHKHVFISEMNPHVRHLIYSLYGKKMQVYKDCGKRDVNTVPRVHVYVFGFPCQSFSPAGKGRGLDDPRGAVLNHCLDYVKRKRPLLVIAENSARLASCKFADVRNMMVNQLEQCGYDVHFDILNTKEQGLPQSRPRFYLVALLSCKATKSKSFNFPLPIDPVPLVRLLEAPGATPAMTHEGKARDRILGHVKVARQKLEAKGILPEACDAVIDVGASPAWGHVMTDCSPCLTAQRCMRVGGHYLLRFNRTMTEKEVCRLQGIPDSRVDYVRAGVSKAKFLQAVGNAMSSNVLARVLARALPAAGLAEGLTSPNADAIFKYLVK